MTAEMNLQRPGWAEPVGNDPRPNIRWQRALGALGVLVGAALAVPQPSAAADTGTAPTTAAAPLVPLAVFPVQPPCAFWDTFGAPRPPGRVHEGTDIGAAEGQPVYAVQAGTIAKIYLDSVTNRGGNSLRLTAADGTYYFYGHLSSFAEGLAVGQTISAGAVIGYIGHTGNAGNVNHLHFEIHPAGGAAVNGFASLRAVDACKKPAKVSTPAAPVPTVPITPPAAAPTGSETGAPAAPAPTLGATTAAAVPTGSSAAVRLAIPPPARVVNSGAGLGAKAAGGARTTYTVTGVNGVPATATLVLLNVTATSPGSDGHLTVLPCSASDSGASTLNFRAGSNDAASALVAPVGGQVCVESSVSTNVTIDVVGYDGKWSAGVTPIRPTRLLQSVAVVAGTPVVVKASGVGNVPPSNGLSVAVTTSNAGGAGTVTLYACDKKKPKVAQVSVGGGPSTTGVNTRLAADGTLCVVSNVNVTVSIDATAAWALGGSNKLRAVTAVRAYDSRDSGSVAAGQVVQLQLANDELPWAAKLASVVITGLGSSADGTITVWPCGQDRPEATAVTVPAGRTSNATAFVGLGNGKLCLSPSTSMQILVDVTGGA